MREPYKLNPLSRGAREARNDRAGHAITTAALAFAVVALCSVVWSLLTR